MLYKILLFALLMNSGDAFAQKGKFRLVSYNIRNAKGMDNKTDYDRTIAVLKNVNADVIALQEVDSMTKRSNGIDVLQHLAQKMKLHGVYGAAIAYQGGKYGVGVLSKQKPLRHYTVTLPGREEQRVLLVVEFKNYVIFCTHFSLTAEDRMSSVAIINEQAAKFTKPVYLLGDLNAEPPSPAMQALKADWKMLNTEAPTFPAPAPDKCIDYIFSRNSKKQVITAAVINEPMASDHRPVVVEIK